VRLKARSFIIDGEAAVITAKAPMPADPPRR
jgi:hypothetical protein